MPERRPNILLITTDQQRHDCLGINGNNILRTPNLDALACHGTNFTRAYVTSPVCIPARRTLISGLHPDTHGMRDYCEGWEFDPPATLPGCLSQAGYQTQLVGKLHLHPQRKRFGFDHMILSESSNDRPTSIHQRHNDYILWLREQGVRADANAHGLNANSRNARPFHLDENYHHTSWVAGQAARFFNQWRDPSQPWFLHVSFVAPHPPLNPPQPYWDRYIHRSDLAPTIGQWAPRSTPARGLPCDRATGPFFPEEIHDAIAGYYGLINHIDDQINYLLERYYEYGNPRCKDPTYIIFSSDHGEMLGDHHLFRKSLPYESSSHVPLFISGRNVDIPQGQSDALVSWEDIMPTILDLAGVPIPDRLDGRSLVPVMQGHTSSVRSAIMGECDKVHFVIEDQWKYCYFDRTGEEQLFNLAEDPQELNDCSDMLDQLPHLRDRLEERLAGREDVQFRRDRLVPCRNQPPRSLWPES